MSEKMLVTQALDERDLLVKKISDKIDKASFVDTIKPNEDKVYSKRIGKDEYAKEAESAYQQIVDLIERFQKIDAAIVASNAETEITTSYGKFTVAGAISLRSRLRGLGTYDGEADFEGKKRLLSRERNFGRQSFCVIGNSLEFPITQKGTNVPMMRTRAKQKHVASDRAQRENVPRHILFHFIGKTAVGVLLN